MSNQSVFETVTDPVCLIFHINNYMKITEIISEAHHSIVSSARVGQWIAHMDSHALVSVAHKGVPLEDFSNIVNYSLRLPDVYQKVPIGKGVFFQDVNTMISIYVKRLSETELVIETVLPKSEIPKPPMFRRPVPPHKLKRPKEVDRTLNTMRAASLDQGRDAVSRDMEKFVQDRNAALSQDIEKAAAFVQQLNRQQRRELEKQMRRSR